jgi:hypothetical protein
MAVDWVLLIGVGLIVLSLNSIAGNAGAWRQTHMFAGIAGVCMLGLSQYDPALPVVRYDSVGLAFNQYESDWRDNAQTAADSLDSGTLKTDIAVREFLSTENIAARRRAFKDIAKHESEVLSEWTPESHITILRSYSK